MQHLRGPINQVWSFLAAARNRSGRRFGLDLHSLLLPTRTGWSMRLLSICNQEPKAS
jgi:hypothetical protein